MDDRIATHKALARRLYEEIFGRGNYAVADEILAPDIVSNGPGMPPRVGTDGIKLQAERLRLVAPDLEVELLDQVAEGDKVASRWAARGTQTGELVLGPTSAIPATGRQFEFHELRIDRFENGRIVEAWFIPDRMSLVTQLGPTTSTPEPSRQ